MPSYVFFGIQIALASPAGDSARGALRKLISAHSRPQSELDKRSFWLRFSVALAHARPAYRLGHWDLIRGAPAEAEFKTWHSEIEAAAASEELAFGAGAEKPGDAPEPGEYLLVTQIFLVGAGTNADLTLGERCDIHELDWHTSATYERLVNTPPLLNYTNVRADAVYLQPGRGDQGLTATDLADEAYEYLKPITRE